MEAGLRGRRRAALALHAMHPDDRRSLLQALPPHHRRQLQPLLDELAELGIPADGSLLTAEGAAPTGIVEAVAAAPVASPVATDRLLASPNLRELADLLRGEPPGVVQVLLGSRPWSWAAPLANLLPRECFDTRAVRATVAPALTASVCQTVADQLARRPTVQRAPWTSSLLALATRMVRRLR